ncbi:Hpt domain-containing protein [Candidatus Enterovibrio escicola]|uniref:Hpt domain-containing protein n=1 Tax=Candidatus Enterovibrio escicola TaxID=1927127 RepID=UPI001237F973|nr:Hpt domain-containing protein [Candidatus Enterovibrio escacola]
MEYDDTLFDLMVDNIPGINLNEGMKRFGGNKAKYLEILSLFLTSQVSAMEQLLTLDNNGEKAILAHSCKGAGGNIGAGEISAMADVLEEKYNAGDVVSECDVLVLQTMITDAIVRFDEILSHVTVEEILVLEEKIRPLEADLMQQLDALQVNLRNFDIGAHHTLTLLSKILPRWCNQLDEFKNLKDAVNRFDFVIAEEYLIALKKKAE